MKIILFYFIYLFYIFNLFKLTVIVNNQSTFSIEEFNYPLSNMRLFLGCDGGINKSIKNQEVYLLEIGTFIVFQEVFNDNLISQIFNLKGQYDLLIFRNYEIKNFLNSEISSILSNLKKVQKFKIEQSVFILISENVIKKFIKKL